MRFDERSISTALHALSLAATVRTALGVSRRISDRRAGRDPSEDEQEAPVRAYLADAVGQVAGLVVQLRLRAAADPSEEAHAALVEDFEALVALITLSEELRVVHQKLLSLYPAVDVGIVESVRRRALEAQRLIDIEASPEEIVPYLERLSGDLDDLGAALVERS